MLLLLLLPTPLLPTLEARGITISGEVGGFLQFARERWMVGLIFDGVPLRYCYGHMNGMALHCIAWHVVKWSGMVRSTDPPIDRFLFRLGGLVFPFLSVVVGSLH